MITDYLGSKPQIAKDIFIAQSADIIGKVTLKENSSVWHQASIRADVDEVIVGVGTNIQEGTIIHEEKGHPTIIGDYVTVGHRVTLHGCKIGNNTLIGMGSIILDGAEIGEFTLIGAGSLVPPNKKIPSGVLVMGSPAKVVRELSDEEKQNLTTSAINYIKRANEYK